MATGAVFTVTTSVAEQLPMVYDIVDVPGVDPVTVPSVPTVATRVLLLVQTPPAVASVSAVVVPWQIIFVPVITAGCKFTVTVAMA